MLNDPNASGYYQVRSGEELNSSTHYRGHQQSNPYNHTMNSQNKNVKSDQQDLINIKSYCDLSRSMSHAGQPEPTSGINSLVNLTSLGGGNQGIISAAQIQMAHEPQDPKEAQYRLSQVKDVLKNSKTLKEQLKGVCNCYDEFVKIQCQKEDQKAMSLMKNFFL